MKTELLDGEQLLADGLANLFRGWEGVGGRLYVTNRRVIFESHMVNIRRGVTEIPLADIEEVRPRNNLWVIPNGMEIETRDGIRYRFVVWGRKQIIDMIEVCKSGAVWGGDGKGFAGRTDATPPLPGVAPADPAIRPGSSVEGAARKKEK